MLAPFFTLAAVSPSRQRTFRALVIAHVGVLAAAMLGQALAPEPGRRLLVGNVALVAGILEGALLLGWRLAQLPKSQALEFLLVTPLRPPLVFAAEAAVGLARLALVTLAGLPLLVLMAGDGIVTSGDLPALLLMPFTWGAVTGLGLAAWAYEPDGVRRWGERGAGALIVVYLIVGVLAGEHLPAWVAALPDEAGRAFLRLFRDFHEYNPFGVMKFAMEQGAVWALDRVLWVSCLGAVLSVLLGLRGGWRLQGHFHDEHYRPAPRVEKKQRTPVGDAPLTWWAVRRVSRYAGRINLWLAGGFGLLYAAYTVAGADWPGWLGRQVFEMADGAGGIPALATGLVLLASVPAAFQYGLWDASAQDRCRRLELLLLTRLDGGAYWHAAASAAWRRGRGYFAVALLLWAAAWWAGQASFVQLAACAASAVVLWGLYFSLGFRAFTRGGRANGLGLVLTLVLPGAAYGVFRAGGPELAALVPPGSVYVGAAGVPGAAWAAGVLAAGLAALVLSRRSLAGCVAELRGWYDANHRACPAE